MNTKTILSLYNGEYTCVEKPASKDKRYTDNLSKCISIEGFSLAVSLLLEAISEK